ncbi:MAG: TIGR02270 family protein [Gammaproteobacteria bacterium]|nr:TIGR02270 family protein [Gammaproteobacteria bacterium]
MHKVDKEKLFSHITEQHLDDATFLWLLRSLAMTQPQHTCASIKKFEYRINNHLKGLAVTPKVAWELAWQAAEFQEGGGAFILAMLAFSGGNRQKTEAAINFGMKNPATFSGLLSALGWLPFDKIYAWLKHGLSNQNLAHQHLAIAACSIRRINPHEHLNTLLDDERSREYLPLYCRMLRLAGELKRQDLAPILTQAQNHEDPLVVFWACRSSLLLGDAQALQRLLPYIMQTGSLQTAAIEIAFRYPQNTHARQWLDKLACTPGQIRSAIKALAALGDPHGIDWLLEQMAIPEHAKIAGEAFSTITGVDLKQVQLIDTADTEEDAIDEDEDIDDALLLARDEDQYLPMPHVEKVNQHWQQIRQQFTVEPRYFLGQPVATDLLKQTFLQGQQRHRLAAALELALLIPSQIYPNAKATLYQGGSA